MSPLKPEVTGPYTYLQVEAEPLNLILWIFLCSIPLFCLTKYGVGQPYVTSAVISLSAILVLFCNYFLTYSRLHGLAMSGVSAFQLVPGLPMFLLTFAYLTLLIRGLGGPISWSLALAISSFSTGVWYIMIVLVQLRQRVG